jgi:hypothetical protein
MTGLIGLQPALLDDAGIVLHRPFPDHHVPDGKGGVEPARDAAEDDGPGREAGCQQGRDGRRVDLADARLCDHHFAPVKPAVIETEAGDLARAVMREHLSEVRKLLRNGADQADQLLFTHRLRPREVACPGQALRHRATPAKAARDEHGLFRLTPRRRVRRQPDLAQS